MKKPLFKAYDYINEKFINLFRIIFSKEGEIIGVEDIEGTHYGLHQVQVRIEL